MFRRSSSGWNRLNRCRFFSPGPIIQSGICSRTFSMRTLGSPRGVFFLIPNPSPETGSGLGGLGREPRDQDPGEAAVRRGRLQRHIRNVDGVKDGSSQRPAREFMESLKFPRQGKDFHQTGGPDGSRQPHSHSLPPAGSGSELNAGGRSRVTSVPIVLDLAAGGETTWSADPDRRRCLRAPDLSPRQDRLEKSERRLKDSGLKRCRSFSVSAAGREECCANFGC